MRKYQKYKLFGLGLKQKLLAESTKPDKEADTINKFNETALVKSVTKIINKKTKPIDTSKLLPKKISHE